jgi:rfaE bifunctional protein kinase chain/domain
VNGALNLSAVMEKFTGKRVLVVGDLMIDEHIWGAVGRISPEAPVMVVDAQDLERRPGGAANVVNNVQALGAQASVIGIVGDDDHGRELIRLLSSTGAEVSGIVVDPSRRTTRKTRIWASHRQQVVRVDWESRIAVNDSVVAEISRHLDREITACDAAILSDYNKGTLTAEVAGGAIRRSAALGRICACNAKPSMIKHFVGVTVLTLNQSEAEAAVGNSITDEASLEEAGHKLLRELSVGVLVITLGARGMVVFEPGCEMTRIEAVPIEVYDVAGAGDTVISTLALAMAAGANVQQAAYLANTAGGAVVRKVGVATVTPGEILQLLNSHR